MDDDFDLTSVPIQGRQVASTASAAAPTDASGAPATDATDAPDVPDAPDTVTDPAVASTSPSSLAKVIASVSAAGKGNVVIVFCRGCSAIPGYSASVDDGAMAIPMSDGTLVGAWLLQSPFEGLIVTSAEAVNVIPAIAWLKGEISGAGSVGGDGSGAVWEVCCVPVADVLGVLKRIEKEPECLVSFDTQQFNIELSDQASTQLRETISLVTNGEPVSGDAAAAPDSVLRDALGPAASRSLVIFAGAILSNLSVLCVIPTESTPFQNIAREEGMVTITVTNKQSDRFGGREVAMLVAQRILLSGHGGAQLTFYANKEGISDFRCAPERPVEGAPVTDEDLLSGAPPPKRRKTAKPVLPEHEQLNRLILACCRSREPTNAMIGGTALSTNVFGACLKAIAGSQYNCMGLPRVPWLGEDVPHACVVSQPTQDPTGLTIYLLPEALPDGMAGDAASSALFSSTVHSLPFVLATITAMPAATAPAAAATVTAGAARSGRA